MQIIETFCFWREFIVECTCQHRLYLCVVGGLMGKAQEDPPQKKNAKLHPQGAIGRGPKPRLGAFAQLGAKKAQITWPLSRSRLLGANL
jgi:hypothetical protein